MEWETPSFFWEKGQSEMTMEERIIIKKYFLSSFQISLFFDIFIHEYNAFWSYIPPSHAPFSHSQPHQHLSIPPTIVSFVFAIHQV